MERVLNNPKASLAEVIAMRKSLSEIDKDKEVPQEIVKEQAKPLSLKELLFKQRGIDAAIKLGLMSETKENTSQEKAEDIILSHSPEIIKEVKKNEQFSMNIKLNAEQLLAKEMAFAGKSFCIIGAAGTGKTTAQREIAAELLRQDKLGTHVFRVQGQGTRVSAPSIAFIAMTRIASGNLRRAIHKDPDLEAVFEHNITTAHNLLEYQPETYWDPLEEKEKFRFVPKRTANNPLDITHLVIEESSMVDVANMWKKLYDAMRSGTQIIFIGDINQLPPVFGASILNYALVQLPVVELKTVYRQAGDSTILENAHRILKGESLKEAPDFVIMRTGTVQHTQAKMSQMIGQTFPKWYKAGEYDPAQDIILSPFNKQDLGTDNLNKWIAQFLGADREAVVHEIIAGMSTHYLAVGDKIMYNKQVGEIVRISRNYEYQGKIPQLAGQDLTRFGTRIASKATGVDDEHDDFELAGYESLDLDKIMDENMKEDVVRQASSIVTIKLETEEEISLSTVGDFAPSTFSLGYCLTVHKAQGCEWRKVYIILHKDHSIMAFRELLYTAVTRAKEKVVLIAKDFMIEKAIRTQRIKGNTIQEKIEYFNSGTLTDMGDISCLK
jgi:ATP-dependent exoDNAse (exonuclease V) alpha subunit